MPGPGLASEDGGNADGVRSNGLPRGEGADTMVRNIQESRSWGYGEWKVIKKQSTFDPINLLYRTSPKRSWIWTFFFISKAFPVIPKRKGTVGTPPVCLHLAELKRSLSATYIPLSSASNGYF